MYPEEDLGPAADRLRMFLEQYWGGPTTYSEQRGHPRLRMRHAPFKVGPIERDAWLRCMDVALDEQEMPSMVREFLRERFRGVADHMRNRPEEGHA